MPRLSVPLVPAVPPAFLVPPTLETAPFNATELPLLLIVILPALPPLLLPVPPPLPPPLSRPVPVILMALPRPPLPVAPPNPPLAVIAPEFATPLVVKETVPALPPLFEPEPVPPEVVIVEVVRSPPVPEIFNVTPPPAAPSELPVPALPPVATIAPMLAAPFVPVTVTVPPMPPSLLLPLLFPPAADNVPTAMPPFNAVTAILPAAVPCEALAPLEVTFPEPLIAPPADSVTSPPAVDTLPERTRFPVTPPLVDALLLTSLIFPVPDDTVKPAPMVNVAAPPLRPVPPDPVSAPPAALVSALSVLFAIIVMLPLPLVATLLLTVMLLPACIVRLALFVVVRLIASWTVISFCACRITFAPAPSRVAGSTFEPPGLSASANWSTCAAVAFEPVATTVIFVGSRSQMPAIPVGDCALMRAPFTSRKFLLEVSINPPFPLIAPPRALIEP